MAHHFSTPVYLPPAEPPPARCLALAYKLCCDLAGTLTPEANTDIVSPLNLGYSDSASIRVSSAQGRWIVKMPRELSPDSVSAGRREAARAQWVGEVGLGPKVHKVDELTGSFVMSFLEATPLTSDEFLTRLPEVMNLLHRFHDLTPPAWLEPFSILDIAKFELAQAQAVSCFNAEELRVLEDVLKRVELTVTPCERLVTCHNDFWSSNILSDNHEKLWLVDFPSVGLADPLYDVGYLASELEMSPRHVALAYGLCEPQDQLKVVAYYYLTSVWLAAWAVRRPGDGWQDFAKSHMVKVWRAAGQLDWLADLESG